VIRKLTCLLAVSSLAVCGSEAIEPPVSGGAQRRLPPFISLEGKLTLADALSMAERFNPQLRASLAGVERAQAGVSSARAWLNPTLTFGSLGRQRVLVQAAAYPGMLHGLNITQPVELPLVRSSRIRAAQIGRETSEWELAETRLQLRGVVKQTFYEALRQEGAVAVAKGNLDLLEDLRRRIEVQVDVGEAARLELTRAEAELASARIQVQSAELRLAAAKSSLSAAIGAPIGKLELEADLDPPANLPPLESLRSDMLARHPTLALADAEIRRADATVASEKAQRIPQPSLWMDWFQQPEAAQYRFGITIPIPILNRREGPIAEALASRRQASAVADQRRLQLTAALEQAYNLYQVANQQVEIFETGTLRQAEAAVRAAQAAFKFGERGIMEVLDAQRVLRAAQLEYLNAKYDRQHALVDLEQLRVVDLGGRP
jgi:cobalt-zinc-cadmium efflux system outer membrane protein